jgi:hypothetical protein
MNGQRGLAELVLNDDDDRIGGNCGQFVMDNSQNNRKEIGVRALPLIISQWAMDEEGGRCAWMETNTNKKSSSSLPFPQLFIAICGWPLSFPQFIFFLILWAIWVDEWDRKLLDLISELEKKGEMKCELEFSVKVDTHNCAFPSIYQKWKLKSRTKILKQKQIFSYLF